MIVSLLHISDLHRDRSHPLTNAALLDSLARDKEHYGCESPAIRLPDLILVSGDLVSGIKTTAPDAVNELDRQYDEAYAFLTGLADLFLAGDHNRIVIVPGNHDVSYPHVYLSLKEIHFARGEPTADAMIAEYVRKLYSPGSSLRWSWNSLCFYELIDTEQYRGKVILVLFWSTWCKPCTEDLPQIRALYEQYADRGFESLTTTANC